MTDERSDTELIHKIRQSLSIAPRQTIGMLQSFIGSKITNKQREAMLLKLSKRGEIVIEFETYTSYGGITTTARIVALPSAAKSKGHSLSRKATDTNGVNVGVVDEVTND